MTFSDIMIKNSMIILSLCKNAEIVNINTSDGTTITYKKSELADSYRDSYGAVSYTHLTLPTIA